MRVISNKAFEFLCFSFDSAVKEFLDDPDGMFGGSDAAALKGMAAYFNDLLVVAKDCKKDFWEVAVNEGTTYEIERLIAFLRSAGETGLPDPKNLPEGRNGFE